MGFYYRYLLLPLVVLFFMTTNSKAQGALISSSFNSAMSSDTFVSETPSTPQEAPIPAGASKGYNNGPAVDYNKIIANKLFPDDKIDKNELIIIDISKNQNKIKVEKGRIIEITLAERVSHKWLFEYDKRYLEIVKQARYNQNLVVQFRTKEQGNTKIYLDYLDESNHGTKVLGSKVVLITIGK